MKKALLLLSLLVLTVSLTACGGSSGSSSTPDTPVSGLSGAVAAAPVKDAKVMVSPEYLTAAAKKAGKAIAVGTTDKTGKIIFDAANVAKLDRSANVVMYSDGGVKFSSAHNTVAQVEAAGVTTELFKGTMRAILAPKAKTAYLTVANSIVADMVLNQKMVLADAERVVMNLVLDTMSLNVVANPLGDPTKDVFNAEVLSQTLLEYLNVSETDLANGVDVAKKFEVVSKKLKSYTNANAQADRVFIADNFAAIKASVKTVLGDDYKDKAEAMKEDEITSAAVHTIALEGTGNPVFEDGMQYIAYEETPIEKNLLITVNAMSNKPTKEGKFVLEARPAMGKVLVDGEEIAADSKAVYSTSKTFTFNLTVEEVKAMAGKDAVFTFKAVDGEFVKNLTFTYKFAAKDQLIVNNLALSATDLVLFEDAELQFANIADKDANVPASIVAAASFTFNPENGTSKKETLRAVFTAPSGFQFKYISTPAEDATYSIADGVLTIKKEYADGIATGAQTIAIANDTVAYQNLGGKNAEDNAGQKSLTVELFDAAGKLVDKDVYGDEADETFIFAAGGTENVVQAVITDLGAPVAADVADYATAAVEIAGTGTEVVVVYAKTWNSVAGTTWNNATTALKVINVAKTAEASVWFAYSANDTMAFTSANASTAIAATAVAPNPATDSVRKAMYKFTLNLTDIAGGGNALKVQDTALAAGTSTNFFFKAADAADTAALRVLPTDMTTGGVKIEKSAPAGEVTDVTIEIANKAASTASGNGDSDITPDTAVATAFVATSAINTDTHALLMNPATWTTSFTVDSEKPTAVPYTITSATPVENGYTVVFTFGDVTPSANDYTGTMNLIANEHDAEAITFAYTGN